MKIGKRTAKLLREAIVLAYVEGVQHGQFGGDDFPRDSEIIRQTLIASVANRDRFPTLAGIDEAQACYEEHRRRTTEMFKVAMETAKDAGS